MTQDDNSEARTRYAVYRLMVLRPEWCAVSARVCFGEPRLNASRLPLVTVVWAARHGELVDEYGVDERKAAELTVLVRDADAEWDEAMKATAAEECEG